MRRFQSRIGDHNDLHIVARLETLEPAALFIQQVSCDFDRQLCNNFGSALLSCLFADDAQNSQCERLDAANIADTGTTGASHIARLAQRRTQSLSRHFQQAEATDLAYLDACAVCSHGFAQPVLDFPLVSLRTHIDKVDDNQPAKVTQPQLACDFVGRLEVGGQCGRFDVAALGRSCRVDVDGHQRLGMIDDEAAAGGQRNRMGERRFDLRFDLVAGEQGNRICVVFQLAQIVRHDLFDKFPRFLIRFFIIDENLADFVGEIVAQRANDGVAFAINQERGGPLDDDCFDCFPYGKQVVQVPDKFLGAAVDAGGAKNDAHALGYVDLRKRLARKIPVFTDDTPRDTART